MSPTSPVVAAAAACAQACVAGCASPDTHYVLSPDKAPPAAAATGRVIGLGPVSIPDYINRPELVFQRGPNRFEVPANHRWVGSIEENIADVLAANLARRIPGGCVLAQPWPASTPAVRVAVDIERFHAVSGAEAILEATWHVSGHTERPRRTALHEPLLRHGYDGVVAAQNRLLARLADAIAESL